MYFFLNKTCERCTEKKNIFASWDTIGRIDRNSVAIARKKETQGTFQSAFLTFSAIRTSTVRDTRDKSNLQRDTANPLWLPVGKLPLAHPYLLLFSCTVTHRTVYLNTCAWARNTHARTHARTHACGSKVWRRVLFQSVPAMILGDDASPKRDCLCTLSSETTRAILALPSRDKIFRAAWCFGLYIRGTEKKAQCNNDGVVFATYIVGLRMALVSYGVNY